VPAPRRRYPTDLTDQQWALLAPLIPAPKPGGRPAVHDRRELVDAMLYLVRSGGAWRLLPHDFPPLADRLPLLAPVAATRAVGAGAGRPARAGTQPPGPQPHPSAAVLDSQSVKTTEQGGPTATTAPRS
jgi:putative transposase